MIRLLLPRLLSSVLLVWLMSVLVFVALYLVGNPVEILASTQSDPAEIARISHQLGLDQPWWRQYLQFVNAALQGDLGRSFISGEPALRLVAQRLPATLELAVAALILATGLGVPLGLVAGLYPRTWAGRLIDGAALAGVALPGFWVGLLLILIFSVTLGVLPASGRGATHDVFGIGLSLTHADGWRHLLLPAVNLALFKLAVIIRLTASSTRATLSQDHILQARAKGLSPLRLVGVHVLRSILLPLLTIIGMEFGALIAFAVVTETVFAWPGLGKLLIDAMIQLDRPVVLACLLFTVCLFIVINLAVDLLYLLLDPRTRGRRGA